MEAAAYLERIGLTAPPARDLSGLRRIQEHHLRTVPFENLDIMCGRPIQLDVQALYDKIVRRRRGGYCYELNGLAAWLLLRLGYCVSMLSGCVRHKDGTFGPDFDHMLLLVEVGPAVVVDVGFGDSARSPLRLTGEPASDISGTYRIGRAPHASDRFVEKLDAGVWAPQVRFTLQPRRLQDFAAMNLYQQTSPESHFTHGTICSLATTDGRISMTDEAIVVSRRGQKLRQPIRSAGERSAALISYFGIDASGIETNRGATPALTRPATQTPPATHEPPPPASP